MTLDPGQILGNRYRIVRLLGQGGFGSVYRAWDILMHGACAVKENRDISPATKDQFEREARMLFQLRHPCLPRVYDQLFIPDQGQYLVMDFVEGEDLDDILRRQNAALPESQVMAWFSKIIAALDYLHNRRPPIIHRDIKPANILITPDQQVYLVDFGIAKVYEPDHQTSTGARALTAGYAPPEQYSAGQTDATSDIYALGATLYHLLTFKKPPDSLDLLFKSAPPLRPAHEINPAISMPVSLAIRRAMELEKPARFQSIREFETALLAGPGAFQRMATNVAAPAKAPPVEAPPREAPPIPTAPPDLTASPGGPTQAAPQAVATASTNEKSARPFKEIGGKTRKDTLTDGSLWQTYPAPPAARSPRRITAWVITAVMLAALMVGAVAWLAWNFLPGVAAGVGGAETEIVTALPEATETPPEAAAALPDTPTAPLPDSPTVPPPADGGAVFDQGAVMYYDGFDSDQQGWDSGQASGEYWTGDYGVADGVYRFNVTTKDSMVDWILAPFNHDGAPFTVAVDVQQESGSHQASFGVLFNRFVDENGHNTVYLFTINPGEQVYNVSRETVDGWEELFEWQFSDAINPSGANRLGVYVEADKASFYINGQYMTELQEAGLDRGRVGIIINVFGPDQSAVIDFDNFEVRVPLAEESPNLAPEAVGPKTLR